MASDGGAARPRRLRDVQELFYDLVTAPAGVTPGLAARGLGAADLEAVVRGDARLSAIARVDIYANMYFFRILDVLRDEYPRTAAAVGADPFHDLITDHLLAHRPAHPSLREAGARLPATLDDHQLGRARPWLAELARLERAHREVFDGPDATALTLDDVRALAPDAFVALGVALIPARAVIETRFAVSTLWEPRAGDEATSAPAPVQAPEPRRELLLVWRQGFVVRHRAIDDGVEEAMLALAAAGGATLGALCERAAAATDAAVSDAAAARAFQILARWVDDGLLHRAQEPVR